MARPQRDVLFLFAFFFVWRVINSLFGQVMKAIRANEPRAISLGGKVQRYKLLSRRSKAPDRRRCFARTDE